MAVAIERAELSTGELRAAARRSKEVTQARRLLALALVLEGASRTEAVEATGMDRQTLRDWADGVRRRGREHLGPYWFLGVRDARETCEAWRRSHNKVRNMARSATRRRWSKRRPWPECPRPAVKRPTLSANAPGGTLQTRR
jgi:Helix-turn-helix domain